MLPWPGCLLGVAASSPFHFPSPSPSSRDLSDLTDRQVLAELCHPFLAG